MQFTFRKRRLQTIGNYQLLQKIGEGGMGSVYKAQHTLTREIVAVKLLANDDLMGGIAQKRFEQEYRTTLELDHPGIVRALESGCDEDVYYFAMEYVDGESLGDRIEREGKLPEAEAVRLMAQVTEALDYAHLMGLIHRDIKPDNLMINRQGHLKLTDFGLVKQRDQDTALTMPGRGLGTPNYAAPEQFENAKEVDLRCDVYSLGATLYTALTGLIPFQAKTAIKTLAMKYRKQLTNPRLIVPDLSERLVKLMARSLSLEPEKRPSSCREFFEGLTGRKKHTSKAIRLLKLDLDQADRNIPQTSKAQKERRTSKRFQSTCQGVISPSVGPEEQCWGVRIQDVSTKGIGLILRRRFEPGTPLFLRIEDEEKNLPNWLMVRVVRAKQQPERCWLLGCEFVRELYQEEAELIRG